MMRQRFHVHEDDDALPLSNGDAGQGNPNAVASDALVPADSSTQPCAATGYLIQTG